MNNEPQKPIPLNYARRVGSNDAKAPAPFPVAGINRGTLSPAEATAVMFDTSDRGDMAFITRALDQQQIQYCITDVPAGTSYKHPIRLQVRPVDADRTRELLKVVIARRTRVKELHKTKPDPFKTTTDGGTWPDPFSGGSNGGFFGF